MEKLYIQGGQKLHGSVEIVTAKNALLPILAGSIINGKSVTIHKLCLFTDVEYMIEILKTLGCKVVQSEDDLYIDNSVASIYALPEEYTKKIRSSIFMLGPLLSRFKYAKVAYPGGCNIGNRPIDLHLHGLQCLNVKIQEKYGYIICDGSKMRASDVHLDFPSVGATENLMMASVYLNGTTRLHNVAREPEIIDLQNFLNAMGAKISGAGGDTITIVGVKELNECEYTPISDRIVTGTYMIACAMAGGKIELCNTQKNHNLALISKLKNVGVNIEENGDRLIVSNDMRPDSIVSIETQPYPGFPTDLQNQILTMATICNGTSVITENLFETRFKVCTELSKMGADITIKDRMAVVKGVDKLYGTHVCAGDLRGGASLVLAGVVADGVTEVEEIHHIDRGYLSIENDLRKLNVDIVRK